MDSSSDEDKPAKQPAANDKKQRVSNGVRQHSVFAMSVATLGLLCAMGLVWWQLVATSNETHRQLSVQTHHQAFAGYVNGRLANLERQVRALAASDVVAEALQSDDPQTIIDTSRSLTELTVFALRVAIVPIGEAKIDLQGDAPISYSALEVIKRAENLEFVGPEGASLNNRNYIYAASPIAKDGMIAAVLFVAFSPDYFLGPMAAFDPDVGQVRAEQNIDGSRISLFTWGRTADPGESVSGALNNSSWTLTFEPGTTTIEPIAEVTNLLIAFALALGALVGGIAIAFSAFGRKIQTDAETLASYAIRLLGGRDAPLGKYKLPIFLQIAKTLSQHTPRESTKRPRRAPAKQAAESSVAEPLDEADDQERDESPSDDQPANEASSDDFLEVSAADDATENFGIEVNEEPSEVERGLEFDDQIFRAYDIRGIVETSLTEDIVYWIGRAFAAEASEHNQSRVAVGRDGRHSSEALGNALANGLTEGGLDVVDIGCVPTPLLYFATHALDTGTGIMITGSHNPPEYNGLKMVLAGETLAEDRIQGLKRRLENNELSEGRGSIEKIDLNDHYVDRVLEDVVVSQPLKVVVDCGNGVAGVIAPRLLEELGCQVVPLYCEVDGDFPNHHPDPADPQNLQDLITVVQAEDAQVGLAFDGDGDRLGVVTASGDIIWPDKLMMLFAQDILGRNPGADIIYDVKCSRHLNSLISENGGRPIMWKTGHSHIKSKLKSTGALLGGEFSGHICFGERWYGFDDAIYSAARLLEIIAAEGKTVEELFAAFPATISTPEIKVPTTDSEKFKIIERLAAEADFGDGTITDIDGLRVDYPDGWGLIRASNTSPVLTLRFEADAQSGLDRIRDLFQDQLSALDPSLKIP